MKNIMVVFAQEIRLLLRDRHALGLLFLMPLALIVFLSLALKDVYRSKIGSIQTLHVITNKTCTDSKSLCGELTENLKRFSYTIESHDKLPDKVVPLSLILPADMDGTMERLQEGGELALEEQIQIVFDPILDQSVRALVKSHVYLSLQSMVIKRIHDEMAKADNPAKLPDVSQFEGLVTEKAFGGVMLPNPIQQSVPAWTLFGMFFIVIPLTNSMIRDRQLGVFKRLLSFPISRGDLVLGKILPYLFINLFQFSVMFILGISVLPQLMNIPVDWGFDWLGILVITLSCAFAATAYGLMISCFAKTSEQAHAFGAMSVVILSIIGGVMIPRFVMPDFMQNLAMLSPLYWGLESYLDILVRKRSMVDVLPRVSVLLAFALVTMTISKIKFKWSEVQ